MNEPDQVRDSGQTPARELLEQMSEQFMFDVSDEQVTAALARWGRVQVNGMHWMVFPYDPEAFCEATDFNRCEARWGGFNVVAHELSRIRGLLR